MNTQLEHAKITLLNNNLTCVLYKDGEILKSSERGVSYLLELYESGKSFKDFHVADKVVGKGAAFLYVLLGIKDIYAVILSKSAKEVLERSGIEVFYEQNPDKILNRTKTGFCPIETAVLNIENPKDAPYAIRTKLEELKK